MGTVDNQIEGMNQNVITNTFIIYYVPDTEINVLHVFILLSLHSFETDPAIALMLQAIN